MFSRKNKNKGKRGNRDRSGNLHRCVWEPVEECWPGRMVVYHKWVCTVCGKEELIGIEPLEDGRHC